MVGTRKVGRAAWVIAARAGLAIVWLPVQAVAGQSPSRSGATPPVAHGFSILRVDLAKGPGFSVPQRAWAVGVDADVAIKNSHTRLRLSGSRFSAVADGAPASLGFGVSITQVVSETETPARLAWISGGVGVAGLGNELHAGTSVRDASISAGGGLLFAPPGIGEVMLSLAPRFQVRQFSTSALTGLDRTAAGAGATLSIDWGSQQNLGAMLALDFDWLSSRPVGDHLAQATVRVGGSYRLLLFARHARLPGSGAP
ncbi:MAG: hypothetical protein ABI647_18385 [Gemmatimonadota bacterium]